MKLIALFTLGFPSAPILNILTSLHTYTRRTVLQKVRYRTYIVLYLLVKTRFQVLFTPLPGSFSPFLHSTAPLSVIRSYLGLGGGPPGFPADSSCPLVLWMLIPSYIFRVQDYHPLWLHFPVYSARYISWFLSVRNPESITTSGLASFPFARRYLGNRCFFLFLRLLRCFSSAGLPTLCYLIHITLTAY